MRFHPSHRPFHPLYGFRFQNQAGTALEGKMQILLQGDFSGAKGKMIFSRRGVVEMKMVQPVSAADYYRLILMIDAVIMSDIKGQREYGAFQQQIQRQKLKIRVAAAVFNADFKVGRADTILAGFPEKPDAL